MHNLIQLILVAGFMSIALFIKDFNSVFIESLRAEGLYKIHIYVFISNCPLSLHNLCSALDKALFLLELLPPNMSSLHLTDPHADTSSTYAQTWLRFIHITLQHKVSRYSPLTVEWSRLWCDILKTDLSPNFQPYLLPLNLTCFIRALKSYPPFPQHAFCPLKVNLHMSERNKLMLYIHYLI